MPAAAPRPAPDAPGPAAPGGQQPFHDQPSDDPSRDPLLALADQCVQCGLCLPACPTYALERTEAESPRGRIALARAWTMETIAPTAAGDAHLDHCLACRSCEAVCPAQVRFGALLLEARARQRQRRPAGWRQQALERLAAHPALLSGLLAVYRRLFPWLPGRWRPLPRPPAPPPPAPPVVSAAAEAGVAVFRGCVARGYEARLQAATAQLAAALGIGLQVVDGQTCCGALHAHAGNAAAAARLATRNRHAFAAAGSVLTLASGCHEALASALDGTAATVDALEFFAARADRLRFAPTPQRVALHLPCTQRNVVGSVAATRTLLARVPGLEVVDLPLASGCCGAAGSAMLHEPARAARHRQPLLDALAASGATRVLSANIGCRLHLANGTAIEVRHPLEFLAQCLQTEGPSQARTPP